MNRNPVLLIHGLFRRQKVFDKMAAYLVAKGWEVHRFDLQLDYGSLGIDKVAQQISEYVEQNFSPLQPIDLIGLSMGGLVTRYYLQRLGGIERVQRLVTISSPHYGTWLAYALPVTIYKQMRPNSSFLQDLNRDVEVLKRLQFTFLWTQSDFVIIPARNSRLEVGREIKLPVFAHAMMARDQRSIEAVVRALILPV